MSKRLDFINIFNTKNEGLRKRILNTYELNKQDKRLFLDVIKDNEGGGSEGGSTCLYVQKMEGIGAFSYLGKVGENEMGLPKGIYPLPLLVAFGLDENVTAFGIPLGIRMMNSNTLQDVILTKEYIISEFPTLQEITEEEFYNTNI